MKRKLLITFGVLLVLVIAALVAGRIWLGRQISRERMVAEMEKGWNCRADLAGTSLSLLHSPAVVEIHGLQLLPRSDEVAKPLDARAAMDPAQVLLSAGEIDLAFSLSDLIHRRAAIQRLHIENFNLRDEEEFIQGGKDGDDHSGLLDELFARPDEFEEEDEPAKPKNTTFISDDAGILSPASAGVTGADDQDVATQPKKKKRRRAKKEHEHKPFKASDMVLALNAEEVSMGNAHIDLLERRTELDKKGNVEERRERHTVFDHVNIALRKLDVDPADLSHHNSCALELSGSIELDQKIVAGDNPPLAQKLVRFTVAGSGTIHPFDDETGEWNPDFTIKAKLAKGSLLGGVLLKSALRPNDMKKLTEWGIDLGDVVLGGVTAEDVSATVHYMRGGKLIVKEDVRLVFPEYEITLAENASFNTHEDFHKANCVLLLGPELSKRVLGQVKAYISKNYGGDILGEAAVIAVKQALMDGEGRLEYKFVSRGRLSKPEQSWDNPIKDVADFAKSAGNSIIDSLFNNNKKDK